MHKCAAPTYSQNLRWFGRTSVQRPLHVHTATSHSPRLHTFTWGKANTKPSGVHASTDIIIEHALGLRICTDKHVTIMGRDEESSHPIPIPPFICAFPFEEFIHTTRPDYLE